MMKTRRIMVALTLLFSILLLQGCSPKDLIIPVTTHNVYLDEDLSMCFDVELKADLSQNYKWYHYATMDIDESDSRFHKGYFNHTYSSSYKYTVRDESNFDFYLILVQDGNLDTARIFPYEFTVSNSSIEIQVMTPYNLSTDNKLKKTLQDTLVIE